MQLDIEFIRQRHIREGNMGEDADWKCIKSDGHKDLLLSGPKALDSDEVSAEQKAEWLQNGLVVLPNVFSREEIHSYNEIVAQSRGNVRHGEDQFGFGDRIGQLHQKYPELKKFAAAPQIKKFLSWAFADEPVLFGSLQFDKGTQQEAHIDAIFFYAEPSYTMAGVWVALEDIHPDAGPLFYLKGSHTWGFDRSEDIVTRTADFSERRKQARDPGAEPAVRSQLVADMAASWTQALLEKERSRGAQRETMPIKAGDAVIWHSLLAHGGSPRNNPSLGRKSVVFHYIGRNTKLYTYDQFFLWDRDELKSQPPQPLHLREDYGISSMRYDYFVTYDSGEELIHKL